MVLLLTGSPRARECAAAIEQFTGERVEVAPTLQRGTSWLRKVEFTAVVVDHILTEADGDETDALMSATGTAIPVSVNLAISGAIRVARDVRAALRRREQERLAARREAQAVLRSELTEAVTGILLSSELALGMPGLPPAAEARLRSVQSLAMSIRGRLEPKDERAARPN